MTRRPSSAWPRSPVPASATCRSLRCCGRHLTTHRLATDAQQRLVFGRADRPFSPQAAYARADRRWKKAGVGTIRFHECRHTFASFMIAAGVNAKALSVYMGHSSVTITFDRYGHLMPGNEAEAAALLDAYLDRHRRAV